MCCVLCAPLCSLATPVPARDSRNILAEYYNKERHTDDISSDSIFCQQATINRASSEEQKKFKSVTSCLSPGIKENIGSWKCPAMICMDYEPNRIPQHFPVVKCQSKVPRPKTPERTLKETQCEEVTFNIPMLYQDNRQDKSVIYTSMWKNISVGCVENILPSSLTHRMAITVPPNELL